MRSNCIATVLAIVFCLSFASSAVATPNGWVDAGDIISATGREHNSKPETKEATFYVNRVFASLWVTKQGTDDAFWLAQEGAKGILDSCVDDPSTCSWQVLCPSANVTKKETCFVTGFTNNDANPRVSAGDHLVLDCPASGFQGTVVVGNTALGIDVDWVAQPGQGPGDDLGRFGWVLPGSDLDDHTSISPCGTWLEFWGDSGNNCGRNWDVSTWAEDPAGPVTVCPSGIPTVSQWGIAIMALLLLIGGKVYFSRRRSVKA